MTTLHYLFCLIPNWCCNNCFSVPTYGNEMVEIERKKKSLFPPNMIQTIKLIGISVRSVEGS